MSLLTTTTLPPTDLIPVAKALGPRLGHPHKSTMCRWILKGIRLRDGQRIKLRAWRFGSRWMTTADAADEFVRATVLPSDAGRPPRTDTARQRASELAALELAAMGMSDSEKPP